ncbi:MAG: STAS domain-containing protein [Verrucomicrobia bacterium]|nr:STAS domain-containing protein [Verrucomicrobiota bacterium]
MTSGEWDLSVETLDGAEIVFLKGAIDASNINAFRDTLEELCRKGHPRVLIDCSQVSYLNSTAFGLLYHCHQLCLGNKGSLALFAVPRKIVDIMKILGLDTILKIYAGQAEALQSQTLDTE